MLEGLELGVVLGFAGADVDAAGQVYTEVEIVAGGGDGPLGGYLDVQPDLWQFPPGHQFPQ